LIEALGSIKESEKPMIASIDGFLFELKTRIWPRQVTSVYIPTLRSLTPHKFFFMPILSAREDGVLVWADIKILKNSPSRELFWWMFSSPNGDIDTWRVRLKELVLMDSGLENVRAFHILSGIVYSGLTRDFAELRLGLEAFCQELPEFAFLIPVAIFDAVVSDNRIEWKGKAEWLTVDKTDDLLEILAQELVPQPDKALLLATRDWPSDNGKGHSYDLLEDFLKTFQKIKESEPAAFSRIRAYVESLKNIRATLT
jgi:hypothetical protein